MDRERWTSSLSRNSQHYRAYGLIPVLAFLAFADSKAADHSTVCNVAPGQKGSFECDGISFQVQSAYRCDPLETPESDGDLHGRKACTDEERKCLIDKSSTDVSSKRFNEECETWLRDLPMLPEFDATNQNDADQYENVTQVRITTDLISLRWDVRFCILQAASCRNSERNLNWLRGQGRPLRADDVFDTAIPSWQTKLKAMFAAAIVRSPPGGRDEDGNYLPDPSCVLDDPTDTTRWRLTDKGLAISITGMWDCSSNTGGGLVTLSWQTVAPLLKSNPSIPVR